MDPRPTTVQAPIHLQIADDIRMRIERGELSPGDSLPTLAQLCERWSCSMNSARGAITLLKAQGLITAGRGKAPIVRIPPGRVVRSSERHQAEKDRALGSEEERAAVGEAETNLGMSIGDQEFVSTYDTIAAGDSWPTCSASSPQIRSSGAGTSPPTSGPAPAISQRVVHAESAGGRQPGTSRPGR